MPTVLNQLNYGLIKFWEQPLWQLWVKDEKERGTFVPLEGQGVNSSFMEATDGSRVHLTRQREILDEAHVLWRTMQSFEIPLKSYKRMPAPEVDYFCVRMVVKCPELQLSASHWKMDEIWQKFSHPGIRRTGRTRRTWSKSCRFRMIRPMRSIRASHCHPHPNPNIQMDKMDKGNCKTFLTYSVMF